MVILIDYPVVKLLAIGSLGISGGSLAALLLLCATSCSTLTPIDYLDAAVAAGETATVELNKAGDWNDAQSAAVELYLAQANNGLMQAAAELASADSASVKTATITSELLAIAEPDLVNAPTAVQVAVISFESGIAAFLTAVKNTPASANTKMRATDYQRLAAIGARAKVLTLVKR